MIQELEAPFTSPGNPDVLVVGAGVFGLWAARNAIRTGKRVLVLEKRRAGAGASGGFLGALMPHMPDRWNVKKQFQFEALVGLEGAIRALESDTAMDCGYRRCGRLVPVTSERTVEVVRQRVDSAKVNWPGFRLEHWTTFDGTPAEGWLAPEAAPHGVQWDDLSARIDPRALVAALAAFVRMHGELREGVEVTARESGAAVLADGSRVSAGEVIVANGWEAYALLQPHMGQMAGNAPIGRGVRGQAMLLEFPHTDDRPIVYSDGAYVVPQAGGRIAVGSSTVENWRGEPGDFDPADVGFHARADALVPGVAGAPVMERWAGIRPRNMLKPKDTEAWFGAVPGLDGVSARIGGFKTGLAIAWRS
ncbi:MAG TPA: FAD-dependent oxidoreductase [Rhizobiaceae bacterium]|nr:FAD-dependent oxidoreductase [Rhizobiaceae bacterium]